MVVTVRESALDRGRLPTHDVRALRKRRRSMAQRCRRLVACAYGDSDSESDSESDAREFYETMASRARRQRRKVGHLLLRHATSYNMVCRPHVEFAMPRLSSPLTELSEYDMEMHTRFNKDEFRMILAELRLIPRRVRTRHRCVAPLELALYVLLRRWTCADR